MIAYVNGRLAYKDDEKVIVDINGVGYEVIIPLSVNLKLPDIGEMVKLFTYHYFKEDAQKLYGFLSEDEKQFFTLLLSISGIGPKGAINILSQTDASKFFNAVKMEDVAFISSFSGIGKKTASRIIVELKDKVEKMKINVNDNVDNKNSQQIGEAIDALIALQFSPSRVRDVVNEIVKDEQDITTEMIIKKALPLLGRI